MNTPKEDRVMAWILGAIVVLALTAQFWTPLLDEAYPLSYDLTTPAQRIWQRQCGDQVNHYDRIAHGC